MVVVVDGEVAGGAAVIESFLGIFSIFRLFFFCRASKKEREAELYFLL